MDCWEIADAVLSAPEAKRVLFYGPPGTGKSHQALTRGLEEGEQTFSLTLTRDSVAAELRGMYLPSGTDGAFVWHDGPAVSAMRASNDGPVRLILNELDRASEDCLSFFLSVLDDAQVSRETLPTGETVAAGYGLRVIGTINGEPTMLPEALQDRLSVQVHIDRPHPDAIGSLPTDLQDAARGTVGHIDPARRLSIRAWYAFAALRESIGRETAARSIFGKRAETVLDSLGVAEIAERPEPEPEPERIDTAAAAGPEPVAAAKTYGCDFGCGRTFDTPIDKARHSRYCAMRPAKGAA